MSHPIDVPDWRVLRARIAGLIAGHRPDSDPELVAARAELAFARLANQIHQSGPDVTPQRRRDLARILANVGAA